MKKIILLSLFVLTISAVCVVPAAATLKVGILPDADSIPLIVAREEGFFNETGHDIEIVNFNNPIERDSALQAGVIDGAISDVLAVAFSNDNNQTVKITSLTNGRYVLLSGKGSGINDYQDLKGVEIAISSNTIIEYVTDRLLKTNGFSDSEIAKIAIPKIPVRLQMLEAGQVKAACLPEPLASVLILNGANQIGDSSELGEAPGIMLFTSKALEEKAAEIKAFYKAYSLAVKSINDNPDSYRELLITNGGFPQQIKESFVFPKYDQPHLPEVETVVSVLDWLEDKGLIKKEYDYFDLVDDRFVH